jgi:hypothetical protein
MQLSDDQKRAVSQWVAEGVSLSEIQSRIKRDFDISLTYMDVRLLVAELNVSIPEPEPPPAPAKDDAGATPAQEQSLPNESPLSPEKPAGSLRVTVDDLALPHALISGKVTFSDGVSGEWYIDQMGRLALNPSQPGYRPSDADVMGFQRELQRIAQSQGLY